MFTDIPGYNGLYACDEFGNIFSYPKKFNFSVDGKILKQCIGTGGYPIVVLHKEGKQKTFKVAHLIMYTFKGPRPKGLDICHNDSNKLNSKLDNLRYDTKKSNTKDTINLGRHISQTNPQRLKRGILNKNSKPVSQYTKDGIFIREWENAKCVKRELNYNQGHIASCCRGERKTAHGYIWKFKPLPAPPKGV